MIIEYIQFGIAASFMLCGVATIFLAVFGVYKFNFALNRMHSAALGDTLGMSFILFGLIILKGFDFISLKILLVLLFMWLTSPITSHLLGKLEYTTNKNLADHCEIKK